MCITTSNFLIYFLKFYQKFLLSLTWSEVFTAVKMLVVVNSVTAPRSLVGCHQLPENGGSRLIRNVDNHLPDYTASKPRRLQPNNLFYLEIETIAWVRYHTDFPIPLLKNSKSHLNKYEFVFSFCVLCFTIVKVGNIFTIALSANTYQACLQP